MFFEESIALAILSQRPVQLSTRPIYQPIRFPEEVLVKGMSSENPRAVTICVQVRVFFWRFSP